MENGIMAISFKSLSGGAPKLKTQRITSTTTWTAPSDCYTVEMFGVAGGGGGGGWFNTNGACGGGGGGGGLLTRTIPVTPGASYTITIGAGGSGGGSSANGTTGGTTSFGSLQSILGGGGGGFSDVPTSQSGPTGGQGGQNTSGRMTAGHGGGMGGYARGPMNLGFGDVYEQDGHVAGLGFNGSNASADNTNRKTGGAGLNGFSGGGMGGQSWPNNTSGPVATPTIRNSGAGWGAQVTSNLNQAPGSGDPNSGGGGGGGAKNNTYSRNGANGGSGYMEIKYWTAE